jgi:hypothetical protein
MIARALRRIEADLLAALAEPEIDRDVVVLAARRIAMQAEMIECDIQGDAA